MTGTLRELIDHPDRWRAHKCAYSSAVHWPPKEIRERRRGLGMLQAELAAVLGVSRRAVTNWETGKARPSGANLDALDAVLGAAPIPEPTLTGASDMQLAGEFLRRLGLRSAQDGQPVKLPGDDLGWPRSKTRKTRKDSPGKA